MDPQLMQKALEEYFAFHPEEDPRRRDDDRWVPVERPTISTTVVPSSQKTPQPDSGVPSLKLIPPDPDLVDALRYALNVDSMKLLTPENVFLQQVLRRLKELEGRLDMYFKSRPESKSTEPNSKPHTIPNQLIFMDEPDKEPANTTNEDSDAKEENPSERKETKTKPRVSKRRRRSS